MKCTNAVYEIEFIMAVLGVNWYKHNIIKYIRDLIE